jgi:adenylylsulfate kinase-like enzyme
LAFELEETLKEKISNLVLLDGDSVRSFFGDNLGYKKADRIRQIKRLQKISLMLYNQGSFVIVAALYSNEDLLDWNRKNISSYYEIFMEASFDVLSKRDEIKSLW